MILLPTLIATTLGSVSVATHASSFPASFGLRIRLFLDRSAVKELSGFLNVAIAF